MGVSSDAHAMPGPESGTRAYPATIPDIVRTMNLVSASSALLPVSGARTISPQFPGLLVLHFDRGARLRSGTPGSCSRWS